jgi:hypothetical protein
MDDGERAAVIPSFKTNENSDPHNVLLGFPPNDKLHNFYWTRDNDDNQSSSIPSKVIGTATTTGILLLRIRSGKMRVPPTSFCNKLQKTSICYGLLHTKGGTTSISLSPPRLEKREMINLKKTIPTSAERSSSPSARSRDSTHTSIVSGWKGIFFFLFLFFFSFFISGNVLHHPACSIDHRGSYPAAAASKCHTLKAN